jgi:adenosylhomocysteine nucleosidase
MKILVTFAVDAEFAPWRKLRSFEKIASGSSDSHSAKIGDAEIRVLLTGIGGKKAWVEATRVLWDADIDLCVSSGLAGALRSEHRPGEVLAAQSVYAVRSNTTFPCDLALVGVASSCGAKVVKAFYTTDHVVVCAEEKKELGLRADAVEMESGEILHEAAAFGAKGIAVRGISDGAEEDLPLDFNRVTTDSGDVSLRRVLGQVVQNVTAIPSLIRFGQQSQLAAGKLAEFLDRYLEALAATNMISLNHGVSKG